MNNDRRPGGDKPGFNRAGSPAGGRKPVNQAQGNRFGGDRVPNRGGNAPASRPLGGNQSRQPAEKSSFGGGMRQERGEGSYRGSADRRPVGNRGVSGNRAPMASQNRSFGGDRTSRAPQNRPFGGDRVERAPQNRPSSGEHADRAPQNAPMGGARGVRPMQNRPMGGDRRPAQDRPFRGDRPQGRPFRSDRPAVKPVKPLPDGLAARRVALAVIRDVTEEGAYASLSLDEHLTKSGLSPADRRLASRLAYDTLEQQLRLDWALDQIMARPDTDIKLRNVLRLGACQILLEDRIPESAATNTSVNLCREIGLDGLAGVCNGILRNLVRKKDELVWPDETVDPVKARSIRYSVPEWLVRRLDADWGMETADAIMACHAQESITVRPNLTRLDDMAFENLLNKKVWEHDKASLPHAYHIRNMADIGQDADFLGGLFSIQGESSMMACLALDPKRGSQVLDACAAPGGKACFLAEMMGGSGRVQAWELHDHRTKLIAAQAKRLGLENVRPITRDASVLRPEMASTMDYVLLDAPCTGLGTMADKPDVKYRVTEESSEELAALQQKLLDALCMTVKPGGVMVYSTCSIMKAENEEQIAAFLDRHPEFRLEPLPATIPERFRVHENIGLQLLPGRDEGVSGFYIARLRRSRA